MARRTLFSKRKGEGRQAMQSERRRIPSAGQAYAVLRGTQLERVGRRHLLTVSGTVGQESPVCRAEEAVAGFLCLLRCYGLSFRTAFRNAQVFGAAQPCENGTSELRPRDSATVHV
jgi:hypothetical protein